jgi:hypothetical protein
LLSLPQPGQNLPAKIEFSFLNPNLIVPAGLLFIFKCVRTIWRGNAPVASPLDQETHHVE